MSDITGNSPGSQALQTMEMLHKDLVFKKPTGIVRKRTKKRILVEETYVEVGKY